MNEAFNSDLKTMLEIVSEQLDSQFINQQTCSTEDWGFTKKLFFNPGVVGVSWIWLSQEIQGLIVF
jgi:hypothetical protein